MIDIYCYRIENIMFDAKLEEEINLDALLAKTNPGLHLMRYNIHHRN